MDCSLLYHSPSIFDPYSHSLYHSSYNYTVPYHGLEYIPYNDNCLHNFDFPTYPVPEPPTPVFSEPSVVSALTITKVPSRKRKRTNNSQVPDDSPKSQKKSHPKAPQKQEPAPISVATIEEITVLENDLGYLQDSWASIHIVLDSLKNAFLVTPFEGANEQQLDELDRELGIAYDDLMIQVRQLDRSLKQLDGKISRLQGSQPASS